MGGCSSCDLEDACNVNNNVLVVDKVHKRCDAEPEGTGQTRTWRDDSGACTCDLSLEGSQYFLRNCKFTSS